MKVSDLISGIRRKLGTDVEDRYTSSVLLATIEEIINFSILRGVQLDCFFAPEKIIAVQDGKAELPDDFLGMVIDIDNGKLQKVKINEIDEYTEAGIPCWTLRRDVDNKQKIFLNHNPNSITIRYIAYVNISSQEVNIGLPYSFKNIIETLTAGKILEDDKQEGGTDLVRAGVEMLVNEIALQQKAEIGASGFSIKNEFENGDMSLV